MDELRPDDPRWIGAYRLLGRLGVGGMGRVYLARSDRGRTVAVKLVRAELAAQEEFRGRFRREVRAARRVGGQWTAPVLDADTEAEIPWVATGYVAGPSLQHVVGKEYGPLPARSVRFLASGLAHALADIHAAGLVHRDLKPSNVMITIDGPRVIDFGIARALETVSDGSITYTGAMVGSPAFMSPEQVRGDRVTPACDIFCLGSVLAYAATGLQPFGAAGSGVHAQMFRIVQEPPDLHAVPQELRGLVAACLVKDPEARPSLAQVQEQVAALGLAGDGFESEPWLPGGMVAQLGRHAVRLLELESAETGTVPVVAPEPGPAGDSGAGSRATPTEVVRLPTVVSQPGTGSGSGSGTASGPGGVSQPGIVSGSGATSEPGAASGPGGVPQPGGPGYVPAPGHVSPYAPQRFGPPPPAPGPAYEPPVPRTRRGALIAVLAVLAVTAGAATAFVALRENGHNGDGQGAPAGPTPATTHSATTASGGIPAGMIGTWQTSFTTSLGDNTRVLTVDPDGTVVLKGDSATYTCEWSMHVVAVGSPVELSPSTVTGGEPVGSCNPGGPTSLTLVDPTHLRRDNLEGDKAPLTYEKAG